MITTGEDGFLFSVQLFRAKAQAKGLCQGAGVLDRRQVVNRRAQIERVARNSPRNLALIDSLRRLESRRDCIVQPRVASLRATLGNNESEQSTLQGLYPRGSTTCDVDSLERDTWGCNPFRVGADGRHTRTQGSRCATTLG